MIQFMDFPETSENPKKISEESKSDILLSSIPSVPLILIRKIFAVINIEGSLEAQVASLHLLWEETGCISAVEQAAAAQLGQSIASGGVLCNQGRSRARTAGRAGCRQTGGRAITQRLTRYMHQVQGIPDEPECNKTSRNDSLQFAKICNVPEGPITRGASVK